MKITEIYTYACQYVKRRFCTFTAQGRQLCGLFLFHGEFLKVAKKLLLYKADKKVLIKGDKPRMNLLYICSLFSLRVSNSCKGK